MRREILLSLGKKQITKTAAGSLLIFVNQKMLMMSGEFACTLICLIFITPVRGLNSLLEDVVLI